jgi:hypothetical protein
MSSASAPVQDILNVPSQWPASFPKPAAGTRVLTYVFDPKDASKVDAFVKFIKDTFPSAKISVVKDQEGFTSVSITQFFYNLTKTSSTTSSTTTSSTTTSSTTTTTTEDPTPTATTAGCSTTWSCEDDEIPS